jgi:hypothetical protein
MRRSPVAAVVVGIGAILATMLIGGPDPVASARSMGTSCAQLQGPFPTGSAILSGCTDLANTGGAGTLDQQTGQISWPTGRTTNVSYTLTPVQKDEREKQTCPATSAAEFELRGMVTADTTGSIGVGEPVTGEVCVRESETISNEPGTRVRIR